MAYPIGLEETRAGTLSANSGYGCRLGENGREDSNGKTTQMSAAAHARWCGEGAWQRAGLPEFAVDYFVAGFIGQQYLAFVHLESQRDLGRSQSKHKERFRAEETTTSIEECQCT